MSRWDAMHGRVYGADDDSEEEGTVSGHKAKPRRKSHQRPQGSDQIRQAFSKRKKGLVLKAFQLNSLTDAKVFMFIVNDKGTSWAYATPGFANSLNQTVLKQLRGLADVPEQAKLFTEVIPCPANSKLPASSRGSSEQTNTQGTCPTNDYVPPSTRTATGSLPARSRSGYSSGSEGGQALGPQGTHAAPHSDGTADATQDPPQFNEQSPTMPANRPPSGASMAYGARNAMHGPGPHHGYGGQHFQPQPGGRMEPPTPCGIYNLLEQPDSNQDSPTEVALSCGGSPSSKLMPPPNAAATVRLLAAQAAASAALDSQAAQAGAAAAAAAVAAGGSANLELLNTLLRGGDAAIGDWASSRQQQAQDSWGLNMFQQQQQQQYMQQQLALQQQQQMYQQQQRYQSQQGGNFFVPVSGPGCTTSVDIPYTAGGALCYGPLPGQRPQSPQDSFDAVQRGLAPLRMGKQLGGDMEGPQSAPAGMSNGFGAPSQWIQFAQDAATACGGGGPSGMRASSDAGAYGGQVYSSYAPSPSSCAMQSSGNGSTPAGGVAAGVQNAAQALMMARGCTSLSHSPSPSPTASLAQRMTVLGMNSPAASPMHPSAMGEARSAQQQGEWGTGSSRGDPAAASYQQEQAQRQHNQGAYMPQTDDLVSDPISEMLMEKPLEQLADDRRGNSSTDMAHRHVSIMEATLHQQQNEAAAAAVAPGSKSSQGGASTPTWQQQPQPPAAPEEMSDLLSLIPPPPKTGNNADKAAWQRQVRHVLSTLKPHQRQELARLSEKQWMTIMAAGSASPSTQDSNTQQAASRSTTPSPVLPSSSSAPAPSAALPPASAAQAAAAQAAGYGSSNGSSYGRGFGGKQRLGPSRLSASSPVPLETSSAEDVAAAAAWLGEECPAAASDGQPGSAALPLPASSNPSAAAASAGFASQGISCFQANAAAGGQMLPLPQQQYLSAPKPALASSTVPNGSGSTPFAGTAIKREGSQEPSAAAGAGASSLMAELRAADGARCPSPLKRRQPSSGLFSSAAEQCGSPLKRACVSYPFSNAQEGGQGAPRGRQLPEPPSFATLMQAEGGEDDAIAWANAAASDSLKRAAGSAVSLGVTGGLASLDSFPSAFLRLGSLQGGDSMQMLNTLPDVAAADSPRAVQAVQEARAAEGRVAGQGE